MSDTTAVHRASRRRKVVIISLALIMVLVAAGSAAVIWWRSRQALAEGGFFGLFPALQKSTDELGRGLMDGSTVSAQFVSDLRAERWREAYQSTSRRFRQQMDEASFERFVKKSPPIHGPDTPIKFNIVLVSGGASVTVNGAESAPKGGVWLLLVDEEGTLKVDRLALGEKAVP
jgi:hypothetical protein